MRGGAPADSRNFTSVRVGREPAPSGSGVIPTYDTASRGPTEVAHRNGNCG
jgi:hypothetical protein